VRLPDLTAWGRLLWGQPVQKTAERNQETAYSRQRATQRTVVANKTLINGASLQGATQNAGVEKAGVGYVLITISHLHTLLTYLLIYLLTQTPHPYLLVT